jgi:hypothetical protein
MADEDTGISRRKTRLDLAVLFASPLVALGEPNESPSTLNSASNNFVQRKEEILTMLSACELNVNVRFDALTTESLKEILEARPKILHLFCSSIYRDELADTMPYMAFENQSKVGVVDYVSEQQIRMILDRVPRFNGV